VGSSSAINIRTAMVLSRNRKEPDALHMTIDTLWLRNGNTVLTVDSASQDYRRGTQCPVSPPLGCSPLEINLPRVVINPKNVRFA